MPKDKIHPEMKIILGGKDTTLNEVRENIIIDGFDYTFIQYSDFLSVNDKEFHELRTAYVKAHKDLYDFIELHCGSLDE